MLGEDISYKVAGLWADHFCISDGFGKTGSRLDRTTSETGLLPHNYRPPTNASMTTRRVRLSHDVEAHYERVDVERPRDNRRTHTSSTAPVHLALHCRRIGSEPDR